MKTSRMEAFSDGVLAIIITIMVLEIKVPHETDWSALAPLVPVFGSYVMSFLYVGIYWNNHHHLLQITDHISGKSLWANLHLLFWISLIPFATGWMGENHFAALPTAFYGFILLCAGIAWVILQSTLVASKSQNVRLLEAVGRDWKGKLSLVFYSAGVGISLWSPIAAIGIYIMIAVAWFIPDRRFENAKHFHEESQ